jgi:flagellar biosynthesis protein FliQ
VTATALVHLAREALLLTVLLAAPLVLASLVTSIVVGLIQMWTGVSEPAIGFAPRAAAVIVALLLFAPTIGAELVKFTRLIFDTIARVT